MQALPVAEVIAVGSELLTPSRADTNSLFITDRLNRIGIEIIRKTIVGDTDREIQRALDLALETSAITILTGGLGPTHDDRTREVVAEFLGLPLLIDEAILDTLAERYKNFHLRMTDNNRRQAMVPEGAQVLENPNGTAPGLFLRAADRLIFLLPGPPRELEPMLTDQVVPIIQESLPTSVRYSRHLRVASQAESRVDAVVGPIYKGYANIETTILSSPGIIELHFNWRGPDSKETADRDLDELAALVRDELGLSVFTEDGRTLAEVVGDLLRERGLNLATAESCTGGMLGQMITSAPGSSDYYQGGFVTYSDRLKESLLGVPGATLKEHGAVSSQACEAMAAGVRRATGSTIAISVTGIAGPGGGTDEKPVGTVFFGLASGESVVTKRRVLPGNRETIRVRASRFALDWLRRTLLSGDQPG